MYRGIRERLPHQVDARARLARAGVGGESIEPQAVVERERGDDFPLVLQVGALDPFGLGAIVDDGGRYIAEGYAGGVSQQDLGRGIADGVIRLEKQAGADRVTVVE